MLPQLINDIRHVLADDETLNFFNDRDAVWVLASCLDRDVKIADLRMGRFAKLLNRPLLKTLIAASGDGVLRLADLYALANAERMVTTARTCAAMQKLSAESWRDYHISLSDWGTDRDDFWWCQMSRRGGNLVVQVNFPSDHSTLLRPVLRANKRDDFEFDLHPVRAKGRPTLAWARLDICMDTGIALIEEVQSDWIRMVDHRRKLAAGNRAREARTLDEYASNLKARYAKEWARVAMFATLRLLRDELGMQTVYMHKPATGAKLKMIGGRNPPRSIYTDLPRSFCFVETDTVPHFLARKHSKNLRHLRRSKDHLFWKFDFK